MSKKKIDALEAIATILPEGLSEDVAGKIADLVGNKIQEEVQKVKEELTIKTTAFLRGNIEKLKEQALAELELENENYRKLQMFETTRAMFAVELSPEDEVNAINTLALEQEEGEDKLDVLAGELDKALRENVTIRNTAKALANKVKQLESNLEKINEQKKVGERQLSDTAIVFDATKVKQLREQRKDENKEAKKDYSHINPFLTSETVRLFEAINKE